MCKIGGKVVVRLEGESVSLDLAVWVNNSKARPIEIEWVTTRSDRRREVRVERKREGWRGNQQAPPHWAANS